MKNPALNPPAPLLVALSLTVVEGLLLIGYGVLELFHTSDTRLVMGLTTAAFFLAYGVGLIFCAWRMRTGDSFGRSPVVLAQLIQLGVAWSFRDGETAGVAVALMVASVVTLVGLLHPASIEYLAEEE